MIPARGPQTKCLYNGCCAIFGVPYTFPHLVCRLPSWIICSGPPILVTCPGSPVLDHLFWVTSPGTTVLGPVTGNLEISGLDTWA